MSFMKIYAKIFNQILANWTHFDPLGFIPGIHDWFKYSKINQFNSSYWQTNKEKPCGHLRRQQKKICKV